ncbi:MAG: hypothetical protein M1570_14625 [Chloroflexi bacterium]|nr:hypothetical protein [Chloroflexota bacterium]
MANRRRMLQSGYMAFSGALLLLSLLALTDLPGPGRRYSARAAEAAQSVQIYLPVVYNSARSGLFGHVTVAGSPTAGVPLNLRFYNGSAWSTVMTTTTDTQGLYQFTDVPSLGSGQKYQIEYLNSNPRDSTRLWNWTTRLLTDYTAGEGVGIGDFDLANLTLAAPVPSSDVTLPITFQWYPRAASPNDSYIFELFEPSSFAPDWYTAPLGYVGSYTLNALPTGFATGHLYSWTVYVAGPDGSGGAAYYSSLVTFTNAGSSPRMPLPSSPSPYLRPGPLLNTPPTK